MTKYALIVAWLTSSLDATNSYEAVTIQEFDSYTSRIEAKIFIEEKANTALKMRCIKNNQVESELPDG